MARGLGRTYLGWTSLSAIEIARERAGDLPAASRSCGSLRSLPGRSTSCPARDHARFPDKETLLQEISRAQTTGDGSPSRWKRAAPHGGRAREHAWRDRSGSRHCRRCSPTWSGEGCVSAGRRTPVGPTVPWRLVDRRVRRRRYGHCRADRTRALEELCSPRIGYSSDWLREETHPEARLRNGEQWRADEPRRERGSTRRGRAPVSCAFGLQRNKRRGQPKERRCAERSCPSRRAF